MRFLFNLAMLSALSAGTAAAQDRVSELEDNVNAAGYARRSRPARMGAEAGMGLLSEALTFGIGSGLTMLVDSFHLGDLPAIIFGSGMILVTPAVMAAGVYYGGKWTGGRGSLGWPMLTSYLSALAGGSVLLLTGACESAVTMCFRPPEILLYTAPLWPLLGAIVGYEISDHKATNKLKDKRKGLKQAEEPLMINLLTLPF